MTLITDIPRDRHAPRDDFVLVDHLPNGRITATGSCSTCREPAIWGPLVFEDGEEAVRDALSWAEEHGIGAVHVRGREAFTG